MRCFFIVLFFVTNLSQASTSTLVNNSTSAIQSISQQQDTENPDPWEDMNRSVFEFNEKFDKAIAKPVARTYNQYVHQNIRTGVSNFFSNLDDIFVVVNDILQFKPVQTLQDTTRFLINSTIGIFGIFDVASHLNLPKHNEDFGQTLGVWGFDSGPYLVLPFLGPSSFRDTGAKLGQAYYAQTDVDGVYVIDPIENISPDSIQPGTRLFELLQIRASLLEKEKTLDIIAIDKYATYRDVYLQYRKHLVTDGEISQETTQEDDLDDDEFDQDIADMLEEDEDL